MSNSSGPSAIEEAPAARVLLVVPPFHQAFIPSLGVSLLKAALMRVDIPCDVLYLSVRFAERIGPELYSEIASEGRIQALAGEWVFAGDLFGDRAPDPQRLRGEGARWADTATSTDERSPIASRRCARRRRGSSTR